ncbi:MAG: heavy-metal-associated domain-containing protein [Bacillota bacterium]|jgi:copper chaperone
MQETTLKIQGMSCNGCRTAVERTLKRVEGVLDVKVSLESNEAVVKGTADYETLAAAIEKAGYRVQR